MSAAESSGGFVAGTLVHADKGLVPIEKLQVGDRVLSQPEGTGEKAYKKVVNTFVYDDKTIRVIKYCTKENQRDIHHCYVTDNHPFWIQSIGWTAAYYVSPGQHFQLADGRMAVVLVNWEVYRTPRDGFGWVNAGAYRGSHTGNIVDFRQGSDFWRSSIWPDKEPVPYVDSYFEDDAQIAIMASKDREIKVRVYNIEVEDFHTYYVGELGVWVNNTIILAPSERTTGAPQ